MIAIAITLLRIDIRVIGSYRWVHDRLFRVVRRYDESLIWLNLLFLLCVAFLPSPPR